MLMLMVSVLKQAQWLRLSNKTEIHVRKSLAWVSIDVLSVNRTHEQASIFLSLLFLASPCSAGRQPMAEYVVCRTS